MLLPAYQTLGDGLFLLKEQTASSTAGLSSLPLGHRYYEALLASSTGSSRSIAEIKELLLTQFEAECDILRSLAQESTQESASDFGQHKMHPRLKIFPILSKMGMFHKQKLSVPVKIKAPPRQ